MFPEPAHPDIQSDDDVGFDALIDELDAGINPQGVLVIREKLSMRVVGLVLCLALGAVASASLIALALATPLQSTPFFIATVFSLFFGGCALMLLQQVVFGTYYYLAMTDRQLLRRKGKSALTVWALDDVDRFEVSGGVLLAIPRDGSRRVKLMKGAYAPELLSTLCRKLSVWQNAPPANRKSIMKVLDVSDVLERRRKGNRLILSGLGTAILSVIVVASAVFFPIVAEKFAFQVLAALFGGFMAGWQILVGVVERIKARPACAEQPGDDTSSFTS